MLSRFRELRKYKVHASDGDIGHVTDIYFDDVTWDVRYLVIDTGGWLSGRTVLLSPRAFVCVDDVVRVVPTVLTREQVERSPDRDTRRPVSRQHELELHAYYGWPLYWGGDALMPAQAGAMNTVAPIRGEMLSPPGPAEAPARPGIGDDPHLGNTQEILRYRIEAKDGEFGRVSDVMLDDDTWRLPSLVARTGKWPSRKEVVVNTATVKEVAWSESVVRLNLYRRLNRWTTVPDEPVATSGRDPSGREEWPVHRR